MNKRSGKKLLNIILGYEMMALGTRGLGSAVFFLSTTLIGGIYQAPAHALTDYVAAGTFFADSLEVIQYVYDPNEDTYEEFPIDAFIDTQPFPIPSSTFTLGFTVDESIDGDVPVFSPSAFFRGAISNVTLDINGMSVFDNAPEVATVAQFPGDFQGIFPASWGWSLFPESGSLPLPDLSAFDSNTSEPLGTISAQGFSFRLFDSTRQIYASVSFIDMIPLILSDFDDTSFQLSWDGYSDEEPEFGEEPPEINYTVYGSIDSLTNISAVPLPGGIWLLLSALSGLVVATRANRET